MSTRIAVIGEALVDVVPGGEALVGGSPLNVAVGLARLNLESVFHATVGDDEYGRQILESLNREGVMLPDAFAVSSNACTSCTHTRWGSSTPFG